MSLTGDCSTAQASPPMIPSKSRPWLHGTYSCGIHSLATPRWRFSSRSTTSSRARMSRVSVQAVLVGAMVTAANSRYGFHTPTPP